MTKIREGEEIGFRIAFQKTGAIRKSQTKTYVETHISSHTTYTQSQVCAEIDIHLFATGNMDVKMDKMQNCHLSGNTNSEKRRRRWIQTSAFKFASSCRQPFPAGTRLKRVNQGVDFVGFTGWQNTHSNQGLVMRRDR